MAQDPQRLWRSRMKRLIKEPVVADKFTRHDFIPTQRPTNAQYCQPTVCAPAAERSYVHLNQVAPTYNSMIYDRSIIDK